MKQYQQTIVGSFHFYASLLSSFCFIFIVIVNLDEYFFEKEQRLRIYSCLTIDVDTIFSVYCVSRLKGSNIYHTTLI